jgi:SAM-dependent methyltransferase
MYSYKECPLCGNTHFEDKLTCVDYTVSKKEFSIVSCMACHFVFTNPIPEAKDLGSYYQSEEYISHSNTNKGLIAKLYHAVRSYTLKGKLKLINQYVSRGTILDYGCGTGMFLKTCKEAGWTTFGIEPDDGARKLASDFGTLVYPNKEDLDKNQPALKADIITMWHVLEHVSDLHQTIELLSGKLKSGGILIVAVPNHKSEDASYYGKYWAAYDVPRHLYHFDQDSISRLFSKHQYELINTLPMKFDSFYVSLLSEKYQSGSGSYFKAFKTGLRSNRLASSSGQYSSLIYVLKKK